MLCVITILLRRVVFDVVFSFGKRMLVRVRQLRFRAISPCNSLWRPILIVIINICPFVLALSIFFIQATSHMNSVFLELFVCEFLGLRGWLRS